MTWADVAPYAKDIGGPSGRVHLRQPFNVLRPMGVPKEEADIASPSGLGDWLAVDFIPMIGQAQDMPVVWAGQRQRAVMSSPYYASRKHRSFG